METVCNRCGVTFAATRSDARYCSPRCRTQAHRAKVARPGPKRPRPPLTDAFRDAVWDIQKAVARLERLAQDDRVPRNRVELATRHAGQVRQMIRELQNVVDKLDP